MATISVISSSSSGNAYIIRTSKEILLLELGVPFKEIVKSLNYDLMGVENCLCTHR